MGASSIHTRMPAIFLYGIQKARQGTESPALWSLEMQNGLMQNWFEMADFSLQINPVIIIPRHNGDGINLTQVL